MVAALRTAILGAIHPEGAADESTRRAFLEEGKESNAQTARWIGLLLGPLHALVIIVFLFFHETEPQRMAWLQWLVGINVVLLAMLPVCATVAWTRRPAALYGALGDIGGVVYLIGGAAMTANAQRAYPNVNMFVLTAFFTALRLRMRPSIFVVTLLGCVGLVLVCMARLRSETATRAVDYLTVISASSISLIAFFLTRGMRFRELHARCQVQTLNTQLNEKIQERSRELSMALARLAEGHRDLQAGTVLGGRVRIEEPLGRGGMGIVYRGRDLLTGNAVAVKVVQASSAHELDVLHRFLREAQIVASLTHSAIVRSIHVDVSEDGRLFQMMELVEGETLETCLAREGCLSPPVAARLGAVLAGALAAAHAAGVAHLDVKPGNVILTKTRPGLKLLDFGIAKLWDMRATGDGRERPLLGTPEFLSPEQMNNPGGIDARADVYALGLVLYVAIAGRMPFEASNPPAWLLAHARQAPVDLRAIKPEIDPELAGIVMSCLQKDPRERKAAAVVAALLKGLADRAEVLPLEALGFIAPAGPPPTPSRVRAVAAMAAAPTLATQPSAESKKADSGGG